MDVGSTDWVIIDEHVCGIDPGSRWFHSHANDELGKKVKDRWRRRYVVDGVSLLCEI